MFYIYQQNEVCMTQISNKKTDLCENVSRFLKEYFQPVVQPICSAASTGWLSAYISKRSHGLNRSLWFMTCN
jgi:hypothetical protein